MLSRRFLRIKVMQAIYAYEQDGPAHLQAGEKQLLQSLDKLYELYVRLLLLLVEVRDFAANRIEENRHKLLPTLEDLNPTLHFVNNQLLTQLAHNRDLLNKRGRWKINWADEEELIRKFYNELRTAEGYKAYMLLEHPTYAEDKELVIKVLLNSLAESEWLRSVMEEINLFWYDDFDTALMMADKTLSAYKVSWDEHRPLPTLLKDENHPEGSEDLEFVKELYRRTIRHGEAYAQAIAEKAANWEAERIALMDMVLLKMAICELLEFPTIPAKVTMNEFIELSKEFSSPKSKLFINGLLDNLVAEYRRDGKMRKSGRGLME